MCPEEGKYLAHRQGNPLLGLLPREHAHFGLWREHRGLHGDGVRERLENDVGLRIFYLPMASKIAGLFAYNDELGGCVGINSGHPRDRRHWSLAHENDHFLTGRYQSEITFLSEKTSFCERALCRQLREAFPNACQRAQSTVH